jgi:hypothetical protein
MPSVFVGDEEFRNEFLSRGEAVFCSMASGNERMLIGVQVSSR